MSAWLDERVNKTGPLVHGMTTPCWTWTLAKNRSGYGIFKSNAIGGRGLAHRLAYELEVGPIPEGMVVCHRCDNPPCCNPDHLFLGTRADNNRDMASKGRHRLQRRPELVRGAANPNTTLTEEDVTSIRSLGANGVSRRAIASRFGISSTTASNIINRRTWRTA